MTILVLNWLFKISFTENDKKKVLICNIFCHLEAIFDYESINTENKFILII